MSRMGIGLRLKSHDNVNSTGMEFEGQVARTLEAYGYPIFYRNLRLRYNGSDIAELDIVSTNFIVEVKSGRVENMKGGFNVFYRHNLLPIDYIYFVYIPKVSDTDLANLHSMYGHNPQYQFINTLEQILAVRPPIWSASITSDRVLRSLLVKYNEIITKFQKLHIQRDVFNTIYDWLLRERDTYHKEYAAKYLKLLDNLVGQHIITFDLTTPLFTYPLRSGLNSIAKCELKMLTPVHLTPCYYMHELAHTSKE
jgi:hypothetical protein